MGNSICGNCFREIPLGNSACPFCGWSPAGDREKYPHALPAGAILNGRFILGRVLGQGGFGITYIAMDDQTGQRVAIKEFFPETMATRAGTHKVVAFAGQRQENFAYGMQCFLAEAQTMAQFIGEETIVGIHSCFEENGTAYFVMDYVEGISLQSYLKSRGGRIAWEEEHPHPGEDLGNCRIRRQHTKQNVSLRIRGYWFAMAHFYWCIPLVSPRRKAFVNITTDLHNGFVCGIIGRDW